MAPKTKKKTATKDPKKVQVHETECNNMLNLTAAWVVPVKVEELGAHLQAYNETQPINTAFKLCVKNSQGSMSELPLELIDLILDFVVQEKREECMRTWSARFWNSTGINWAFSLDYIKSQLLKKSANQTILRKWVRDFTKICEFCLDIKHDMTPLAFKCSDCNDCLDLNIPTAWGDHAYAEELAEYLHDQDMWRTMCEYRAMDWANDVIHGSLRPAQWTNLLREHFGVEVWLGTEQDGPNALTYETTALLLPSDPSLMHSRAGQADIYARENGILTWDISKCMAIEDFPQLKDEQKEAFERTVRKLKLTPYSKLERQSYHEEDSTNNAKWPRLATLAQVAHHRHNVHTSE